MAEKISVQIALEGGAEIERQLAGIGEAGQKAFIDISKAADQAGGFKNLKPEEVTQKLKDMGVTGVDALQQIQGAVQSASRLEGLVQGVQKVESAFAVVARVAGPAGLAISAALTFAAKEALSFSEELAKVSAEALKLGLTVTQFDQLRIGMERLGVSAKGISAALAAVKGDLDKMALKRVANDFKTLETGIGDSEGAIQRLTTAATKFTPEGNAAAEALLNLGLPVPGMAESVATLDNFGKTAGFTKKDVALLGIEIAKLKGLSGIDFKIDDTVGERVNKIIDALKLVPDATQRVAIGMQLLKDTAGPELAAALKAGGDELDKFKTKASDSASQITQSQADLADAVEKSQNRILAAWKRFDFSAVIRDTITLIGQLAQAWGNILAPAGERLGESFSSLARLLTTPVANAWQWMADTLNQTIASLKGIFNNAVSSITGFFNDIWEGLKQGAQGAINYVSGLLSSLLEKLDQAFTLLKGLLGFGVASPNVAIAAPSNAAGGLISAAAGGLLGGRGTGTSDSNLAWVSRGEYVTPAAAVAQPGVLAFLEALRRSGGNLRDVLNGMGRFALGGMVRGPISIPAFSGGGSMNNVTIQFPGLPEITGLRAPSGVVDELRKAAALAQVRSGGRKPSRYS